MSCCSDSETNFPVLRKCWPSREPVAEKAQLSSSTAGKAAAHVLGVQAPVGFRDPAGFCTGGEERGFCRRRCVELEPGRDCMLAWSGYNASENCKWPGYLSLPRSIRFAGVPSGLATTSKAPGAGWLQVLVYCLCGVAYGSRAALEDLERGNLR